MGKLINRIPCSRLLISSLPGSALRTHVESLGKPPTSTSVLKTLPDKLDIKRHSPTHQVFSISRQASRSQQAFSKPCLINLISKDTHLVFSISRQASRSQQAFSKPCLVNLISKDTHLVFSISRQASRSQQAFSKPCLVNLISKDTHLVFSISRQASQSQQAFSKPCLINLISKDTGLVFSISRQASRSQQAFSKPCLINLISKDTHLVFSITPILFQIYDQPFESFIYCHRKKYVALTSSANVLYVHFVTNSLLKRPKPFIAMYRQEYPHKNGMF